MMSCGFFTVRVPYEIEAKSVALGISGQVVPGNSAGQIHISYGCEFEEMVTYVWEMPMAT